MSILLNSIIPSAGDGLSGFAQVGINVVRGAAISVATTAAVTGGKGNLGEAAAWGGGMAGLGSFLSIKSAKVAPTAGEKQSEVDETIDKIENGEMTTGDVVMDINSNKNDSVNFEINVEVIKKSAGIKLEKTQNSLDVVNSLNPKSNNINMKLTVMGIVQVNGGWNILRTGLASEVASGGTTSRFSAFCGFIGVVEMLSGVANTALGLSGSEMPIEQIMYNGFRDAFISYGEEAGIVAENVIRKFSGSP